MIRLLNNVLNCLLGLSNKFYKSFSLFKVLQGKYKCCNNNDISNKNKKNYYSNKTNLNKDKYLKYISLNSFKSVFVSLVLLFSISPSYAELQEIKEDWVCHDFADKFCLFEDIYGCSVPERYKNIDYKIGRCVKKSEIIDGNKCLIDRSEPVEIDNKVYFLGFGTSSMGGIGSNDSIIILGRDGFRGIFQKLPDGNMQMLSPDAEQILSGYKPEVGKIYKEGDKIVGLVKETKGIGYYNVLKLPGNKSCGLLRENSSCLKTCSSKKENKIVDGKEVESPSECDKFLEEENKKGEDWEEYYKDDSEKTGILRNNEQQYLKKSCCAENNEYLKYDYNTYYKLDNNFNIDDYIDVGYGKYAKKIFVPMRTIEKPRGGILKEYDVDDIRSEIIRNKVDFYISADKKIVVHADDNHDHFMRMYRVIDVFPENLETFIKKYTISQYGLGMFLKDSRCLKNKDSQCFLPQKETCLVSKRSKIKRCSLDDNPSCEVCVKWGIDIKEFSLDGFKNAKFKCMDGKTKIITRDNPEFVSMRNEAPASYTMMYINSEHDQQVGEACLVYQGRRWQNPREYWPRGWCNASLDYLFGKPKPREYYHDRVSIFDKATGEFIYHNDNYIEVNKEFKYNDVSIWYNIEIEYFAGKLSVLLDGKFVDVPGNKYKGVLSSNNVYEIGGYSDCSYPDGAWLYKYNHYIDINKGKQGLDKGYVVVVGERRADNYGLYCLYKVYIPREAKQVHNKRSSSSGDSMNIRWWEPKFSMRDIEIQEVYDHNLIFE